MSIHQYNVNLRSPLTENKIQKLQLKQEISKVCNNNEKRLMRN